MKTIKNIPEVRKDTYLGVFGLFGAFAAALGFLFLSHFTEPALAGEEPYTQADLEEIYQEGLIYQNKSRTSRAHEKWLEAAEHGHLESIVLVAAIRTSQGVQDKPNNIYVAIEWYEKAAKRGNLESQNALGRIYSDDEKPPLNYHESYKWTKMAADQGSPEAHLRIANAYQYGLAVPISYEESLVWLTKAVNLRGIDEYATRLKIAKIYFEDLRDIPKAIELYKQLIFENHLWEAMESLGHIYLYEGTGNKEELIKAYAWCSVTNAAGAETGLSCREYARTQMDLESILIAQKVSLEFFNKNYSYEEAVN